MLNRSTVHTTCDTLGVDIRRRLCTIDAMRIPIDKNALLDEIRAQGDLGMALSPNCPEHQLALELLSEGHIDWAPFQAGLVLWTATPSD